MKKDSKEAAKMEEGKPQIIQINEDEVQAHVDRLVKQTVEEMLNGMLDAEADKLCQARRYERSPERQDTRAGHYKRKLHVTAGEVELQVPKLRHLTFESAIIERYRRRESSVEEALIEMYLAGVSVRRVEDITEALWGTRVSPGTVSNLNKKTYERINEWRNRPIEGRHRLCVPGRHLAEAELVRGSEEPVDISMHRGGGRRLQRGSGGCGRRQRGQRELAIVFAPHEDEGAERH